LIIDNYSNNAMPPIDYKGEFAIFPAVNGAHDVERVVFANSDDFEEKVRAVVQSCSDDEDVVVGRFNPLIDGGPGESSRLLGRYSKNRHATEVAAKTLSLLTKRP